MRALVLFSCVLACLVAACGSSGGSLKPTSTRSPGTIATRVPTEVQGKSERPPKILAALPEGRLLVAGPSTGTPNNRQTFVIEGRRAAELAPTDVNVSADSQYVFYFVRGPGWQDPPTGLVVLSIRGQEVFRSQLTTNFNILWSPAGSRLVYQVGQTVYVRDISTSNQLQFEAPDGAHALSWLAGDSYLLLLNDGVNNSRARLYTMDATSGRWSEIPVPPDATIGPGAEFNTFSPDGRYISYPVGNSRNRWDLWIMEIASGRTCLLVKNAPYNQYPQRVGWSSDSRSATYFAKYVPGEWSEQHAVDVANCKDTLVDPTPIPPKTTLLRVHDLVVGTNGKALQSPSGRYLLVYGSHGAVRPLRPGETVPTEKPFLLTPTTGDAQMYLVDTESGKVTALVDEHTEYEPTAWLP